MMANKVNPLDGVMFKNIMKIITLLLSLLVIYSCSSNGTPPQPQKPYKLEYTVYTDKNYQYIYRHILKNLHSCKKQNTLSKMIPSGEYFSDIKAADIKTSVHGIFGNYTHLTVGIEVIDNKTKVKVVNELESWDQLALVIKSWVIDDSANCK